MVCEMNFFYYMRDFRASSRKDLICRGLRDFCGRIMVIFDGVKGGEMLDFSGFYRRGYRRKIDDFR